VDSKEDTDMTGYPISNRITMLHTMGIEHLFSVIQKAVILDICHVTRRFLDHEDHEVDINIKEYEDT
jgi:hypothetical protein